MRVVMVEPERLTRQGAEAQLKSAPGIEMIAMVETAKEGLALIRAHRPDVAIVAAHTPDLGALEVLHRLKGKNVTKVIVTATTAEGVYAAMLADARGYILRANLGDLQDPIQRVARDEYVFCQTTHAEFMRAVKEKHQHGNPDDGKKVELTWRELEIMTRVANGMAYPAIADALGLSPHTIRTYARRAYTKLGVKTQAAAVRVMVDRGLLD